MDSKLQNTLFWSLLFLATVLFAMAAISPPVLPIMLMGGVRASFFAPVGWIATPLSILIVVICRKRYGLFWKPFVIVSLWQILLIGRLYYDFSFGHLEYDYPEMPEAKICKEAQGWSLACLDLPGD